MANCCTLTCEINTQTALTLRVGVFVSSGPLFYTGEAGKMVAGEEGAPENEKWKRFSGNKIVCDMCVIKKLRFYTTSLCRDRKTTL